MISPLPPSLLRPHFVLGRGVIAQVDLPCGTNVLQAFPFAFIVTDEWKKVPRPLFSSRAHFLQGEVCKLPLKHQESCESSEGACAAFKFHLHEVWRCSLLFSGVPRPSHSLSLTRCLPNPLHPSIYLFSVFLLHSRPFSHKKCVQVSQKKGPGTLW